MIWILLLLLIAMFYFQPWVDCYKDYRNKKHIVLWYTDIFGKRNFINIVGNQE